MARRPWSRPSWQRGCHKTQRAAVDSEQAALGGFLRGGSPPAHFPCCARLTTLFSHCSKPMVTTTSSKCLIRSLSSAHVRLLTLVSFHSFSIGFGQPNNKHKVCSGAVLYVSGKYRRKTHFEGCSKTGFISRKAQTEFLSP